MSEPPLEDCLDTFWFAGEAPALPDAVRGRGDALSALGRPQITVRGRNLADVLRPLYDALTDGEA